MVWWLPWVEGWKKWGDVGRWGNGEKSKSINFWVKSLSSRDVMYNMLAIVNNSVVDT